MLKPTRLRGSIPLVLAAAIAVVPRTASAQTAQAGSDSGAPSEPPRSGSIPRGASGAVLVAPKEEPPAPPPPPAPVITPPIVTKDEGAAYPAEALKLGLKETVTVVLVLELDVTGAVRNATVEAPDPARTLFEQAAVEAAQKLVIEPAKRNGTPIAARIKHKYEFPPPASRIVGRVFSQSTGAPVEGATVRLRDAAGAERTATTAANGTWSADGLSNGTYHVEVSAAGHVMQAADAEVGPGEEANVVLRLPPEVPVPVPGAPRGDEDDIEEVRVQGKRPAREVTRRTLEQRELSRIPGTNGDALRAIQNLPGVARPPGIAGLLIVRGSAPNATNVFVDGTLIPLVYHFGGLSSVLPTEILEKIDFYPGNFSAQYGRVTGGVIDVGVRDPKRDKIHGLAQVDLIDARVLAEGPIGNTGWNFAVGGRRSWVDVWLKPVLTATGAGVSTAPVYYDYQAMLQRDVGKNGNFRLMFFGSDDRLDILIRQANASDPGVGGGLGLHTGFYRMQARYRQRFSPETELKVMGAAGSDTVEFNFGDNRLKIQSYPITSRVELSQKFATGLTANVGMDMLYAPYDVSVRLPPPPRPGEPPSGPGLSRPPLESKESDAIYRPALYTELEITPVRGTRIVPGIRADYAKDIKSWDVAPRIIARQDLTRAFPKTSLKGGVGVFYQPPQPNETNPVFGVPGAKSARAIHYGLGVEQEFTRNLEVSLEGFYKQLSNVFTQRIGSVAEGRAFGMEVLLRYKPDARFFGWVAYTLSRSELRDSPGEPVRLATFDQTHILTVLGSYRLGRGWEIGGRFRLVSGNLTTPQTYGFFDQNAGAYLPLQSYPPLSERLPAFHQFDIRVDKVWDFRGWRLSAYLDVQNAYNSGNVEGVSYNYNQTKRTYATGLPILPSLGIRAEF